MDNIWQADLITTALAAGEIDEAQAALLGVLYFNANWSTRTIRDFRAERLCEWTGHDPVGYLRTMQRRLKTLRELGWFTWSYEPGVKTPYDLTLRRGEEMGGDCARHRHRVSPILSLNTLIADKKNRPSPSVAEGLEGTPSPGDAVSLSVKRAFLLPALRREVYTHALGTVLDQLLTPSQIGDLLAEFTPEEVGFALKQRWEKVPAERDFRRSLRSFLLNGVQLELDEGRKNLREDFNRIKTARYGACVIERQKRWLDQHCDDFTVFPDIGYDAASLVYSSGIAV